GHDDTERRPVSCPAKRSPRGEAEEAPAVSDHAALVHRPFFAPEVRQTSKMDCGPAVLRCLCEGMGIEVGYDRLRKLCVPEASGTTVANLKRAAAFAGLAVEEKIWPIDHLGHLQSPEADVLPAIVILRSSRSDGHFVVAWRRLGNWVQ